MSNGSGIMNIITIMLTLILVYIVVSNYKGSADILSSVFSAAVRMIQGLIKGDPIGFLIGSASNAAKGAVIGTGRSISDPFHKIGG